MDCIRAYHALRVDVSNHVILMVFNNDSMNRTVNNDDFSIDICHDKSHGACHSLVVNCSESFISGDFSDFSNSVVGHCEMVTCQK